MTQPKWKKNLEELLREGVILNPFLAQNFWLDSPLIQKKLHFDDYHDEIA